MKKLNGIVAILAAFILMIGITSCDNNVEEKPVYYTVTFDSDGGSDVESQSVEKGKFVQKPDDPIKDGFTFVGWYNEKVKFDFYKAITSNITLKAKWTAIKTGQMIKDIFINADKLNAKDATSFAKAIEAPETVSFYLDEKNNVPVWYDAETKTIYYYIQQGKKLELNPDSSYMFAEMESLQVIDTQDFDTSYVTNMQYMFGKCKAIKELNVSNFNTSNVTNMRTMFQQCIALESIDVTKFDTKNVVDMAYMFSNCESLLNLDVTNFVTNKVTTMEGMFYKCIKLTTLDVSKFDTSNVTNMRIMFSRLLDITELDLSSFDMSKVETVQRMFGTINDEVSKLNKIYVKAGTDLSISEALKNSTAENQSQWPPTDDVFYGCKALVGGKGTTWDENHIDVDYARVDGGSDAPGYFSVK